MGKATAILATFDGPLECLIWAVTSLLIHSDGLVDEIIVSINGGDSRNGGDTSLQDTKQRICEEIADLGYPIKVVRSWSRIGFSQPFDLAIPLAKNDTYIVMHDDTFLRNDGWVQDAKLFMEEDETASLLTHHPLLDFPLTYYREKILEMPVFNTAFTMAKASKVGRRWQDYYITRSHTIQNYESVMAYQGGKGNLAYDIAIPGGEGWGGHDDTCGRKHQFRSGKREYFQVPEPCDPVEITKFPTGSWVFYDAQRLGGIRMLPKDSIYHLMQREVTPNHRAIDILKLERLLKERNDLWGVYVKYCPHKKDVVLTWPARVCRIEKQSPPDPATGLKAVVCVGVYVRTYTIKYWADIWPQMNKCGAELVLIHNYDGNEPDPELRAVHESLKPDYYITRANVGFGTGMIHDIFEMRNMEDLPVPLDWDIMIWFTDDNMPTSTELIRLTLDKFKDPEVMLVGHFAQPYNVRTTAFAVRRSFMPQVVFHGSPPIPRRHGDYLEHEFRNLSTQVLEAGYKVEHFNPNPLEVIYDPERFRSPYYDKVLRDLANTQHEIPDLGHYT